MVTRNVPFQLAGVQIAPGERRTVEVPVARMYTGSELSMKAHVVHGRSKGPVLFLSAAIHGDEINGVEIIRRVLKLKLLKSLKGTLIAVPVVNTIGFMTGSRYLPDRRDLNRFFPGNDTGSLTSRMAAIFMEEIVSRSTHGIDFHTGSNGRENLPQIRGCLENPEVKALALAFGAPVVMDSSLRSGSLRQAAQDAGVPLLLYESGQVMRFDEVPIRVGVRGTVSCMRHLGMLAPGKQSRKRYSPILAVKSLWARADGSGIFLPRVKLGSMVAKGDILGVVTDHMGENEVVVRSSTGGVVIGQVQSPLVYKGDAVCHIALIDNVNAAENVMTTYQREYETEM